MAFAGTRTRGSACGCCNFTCLVAEDDFDRADSTNLGSGWTESAGDWSIASNEATVSTGGAVLLSTANIASPYYGVNFITVQSDAAGTQALLIGGRVDANNYVYAYFEFGATDGQLSLYARSGGTDYLRDGPHTVVGYGGISDPVRLRLCWSPDGYNCEVVSTDGNDTTILKITGSDLVPFGGTPTVTLGGGHGIATGSVGGTGVQFDDYVAYKGEAIHSSCPECEQCPYCDDQQNLCIQITDMRCSPFGGHTGTCGSLLNDFQWDLFNGAHVIQRSESDCQWRKVVVGPNAYILTADIFDDGTNYWLRVQLSIGVGSNGVATFLRDLGTTPPNCATFAGMDIPYSSLTDSRLGAISDDPAVSEGTVAVTSGTECSGSPAGEFLCCDGYTLPGTLVLNGTLNGSPYWIDSTLTTTSPAAGYEYTAADASVLQCDFDGGDPPANWAGFLIPSEGTIDLTVLSCDPYHAVGSATFGANSYSVEITE